jgi:predicted transcriptional regulator
MKVFSMKTTRVVLRLEWEPLQYKTNWVDTFIHRLSANDGLPPAAQARIIEEIAKRLSRVRGSAFLHVNVESEGKWFINELKRLCRPAIPVEITRVGEQARDRDFLGGFASLWASLEPPQFELSEANHIQSLRKKERSKLRVLRVISRLGQAQSEELSSLSGYSKVYVIDIMKEMASEKLVMRSTVGNQAAWEITRKGVQTCHISWNLPPGMRFTADRRENNYAGRQHRRTSRLWPKWLKESWGSSIELWDCWTEIYLKPGGYPDALAWGKYCGKEMLFWLEVDTGHSSCETLVNKYKKRWQNAARYAETVGLRMIFVLLAPPWVAKRSRIAFTGIPDNLAVISHEWGDFGTLPYPKFGCLASRLIDLRFSDPYRSKRRKGNQLPFDPRKYR